MANPKVCAICGWRKATTKDHVPPKSIFPKPLPVRMVTVPACAECNNGSSRLDERFRIRLALDAGYKNSEATRMWKEGALRSLEQNIPFQRELAAEMSQARASLGCDRGEGIPMLWPISEFAPVVERIVRGLYYVHHQEPLGPKVSCVVEKLIGLPEEFLEITSEWPTYAVGAEEIFTYRFGIDVDDRLNSLWVVQFFCTVWASVRTCRLN